MMQGLPINNNPLKASGVSVWRPYRDGQSESNSSSLAPDDAGGAPAFSVAAFCSLSSNWLMLPVEDTLRDN
jgi:hypothetical protein